MALVFLTLHEFSPNGWAKKSLENLHTTCPAAVVRSTAVDKQHDQTTFTPNTKLSPSAGYKYTHTYQHTERHHRTGVVICLNGFPKTHRFAHSFGRSKFHLNICPRGSDISVPVVGYPARCCSRHTACTSRLSSANATSSPALSFLPCQRHSVARARRRCLSCTFAAHKLCRFGGEYTHFHKRIDRTHVV